MRRVPAQFSWIDQRLVRDRHLDRLDAQATALYLFLVTVADPQGLSWYGDTSTARRLSIDEARLRRARGDLVRAGLLAYARPLYQVLALGDPLPLAAAPKHAETRGETLLAPAAPEPTPTPTPTPASTVVREHILALHAALGRRP